MFVISAAFALQISVSVGKTPDSTRRAVRDSIRLMALERTAGADRPPRRAPVTTEHERTAFLDSAARTLLLRARAARFEVDSTLLAYDATAYQRLSAGLGFRSIGRDRLLFRTENASRVRWSKINGVLIDLKGRRSAVPFAEKDDRIEMDEDMTEMSPVPYYPGRDALWVGSGMAKAEVDETELIHPIATGAEAYYRYASGDSLTITLSDGKAVRLRELRVLPRRSEWRLSVGSFWFDQASGQLVRAAYRFAAPMNIWAVAEEEAKRDRDEARAAGRRADPDDDVPGWVKGLMSPMEANLEGVTIEYGLYGGRYWLPRSQYAEGYAKAGFMRIPFKMEESFKYASVNGLDSVPPRPLNQREWMSYLRDSLFGKDAPKLRDLPPDERRARTRKLIEADSTRRAAARKRRDDDCRTLGYYSTSQYRGEQALIARVRIPCDSTVLATSPDLPKSIYDDGEELFNAGDRDDLLKSLGFSLQPGWGGGRIDMAYGLSYSRYNRIEGFSVGGRLSQQLGAGYSWDAVGRIATADHTPNAVLGLARSNGRESWRVSAYHDLAVVNDDWGSPLSFGASLGALFRGRDEGFYYRKLGASFERSHDRGGGLNPRLFLEQHDAVKWRTRFNVARALGGDGEFGPNIRAERATILGMSLRDQVTRGQNPLGWRFFGDARAEGGYFLDRAKGDTASDAYVRVSTDVTLSRGFGPKFAAALTASGGYSKGAPVQRMFFLGGAQSVRGQPFATMSGQAYWMGRAEFSRAVGVVRPVIFGDVGWAGDRRDWREPGRPMSGAGVGASVLDGLIRMDVSRGIYPTKKNRFDLYVEGRF